MILPATVLPNQAIAAETVPVDGPAVAAELESVDAGWQATFREGNQVRSLAVADLVRWGNPVELRQSPLLLLTDGSLLAAEVVDADKNSLRADSDLFGLVKLPLEAVAGIVFQSPTERAAREALADQILQAVGDDDRIILVNGDQITGRVDGIGEGGVTVQAAVGPASIELAKIKALIFSPALWRRDPPKGLYAIVGFRDGSRLAAQKFELASGSLSLTLADGEAFKTAQARELVLLEPRGGRAVYLSDCKPDGYRQKPFLDLPWPYRVDRNVTGGMLHAAGLAFLKGIGVHSDARLTYVLDKPYSRFEAEAAIDDSTEGQGSVRFRVLLDGRERWTSAIVRGRMPPTPVSLDLTGVKRLELVVDYADRADEMDHADWLSARLVK